MASPTPVNPLTVDPRQDSEAIENIVQADLVFYRNVELQGGLIQNYRNAILTMAITAANSIRRVPKSDPQELAKTIQQAAATHKKTIHDEAHEAAKKIPSETGSAQENLANVIRATNLLMLNCATTIQQLDVIGEAALVQSVSLILSTAPMHESHGE